MATGNGNGNDGLSGCKVTRREFVVAAPQLYAVIGESFSTDAEGNIVIKGGLLIPLQKREVLSSGGCGYFAQVKSLNKQLAGGKGSVPLSGQVSLWVEDGKFMEDAPALRTLLAAKAQAKADEQIARAQGRAEELSAEAKESGIDLSPEAIKKAREQAAAIRAKEESEAEEAELAELEATTA